MDPTIGGVIILGLIVIGFFIFLSFVPLGLWFTALFAGAHVKLFSLIGMRLRRVPPKLIIKQYITSRKAGLGISTNDLETHYLAAGGNRDAEFHVTQVVNAMISADKAGIELDFKTATAIDLAGRDVLEAVQMSVKPKIITTPKIAAVAKDGIQLTAISRVTVRAMIERLVGGAGEDTIIARVGEGIVTTIGSAESHKQVLENPDMISKTVLQKGLDHGTAFEILSIDIADVDVGNNIGAKLQTAQAEADKKIAQAKAESRRAMAVAQEQEMKAKAQAMRAKVIEAEAQVPLAMADALKKGRLGVMDYYQMKNVVADTEMRSSISEMGRSEVQDSELDRSRES